MLNTRLVCLLGVAFLLCFASQTTTAQDDPVTELIAQMTLEQRVGQLFIARFWGTDVESAKPLLDRMHPGGIVLLKTNIIAAEQVTQLVNDVQQHNAENGDIPLYITLDQEGGRIQRLSEGFTRLPAPLILGAITDTTVLNDYGKMVATELAAVGVNMNLAPSLDLATAPNNPVVRARMYGDNGTIVAEVTNAIMDGFEQAGVIGVAKHFPGHGEATDTHVDLAYLYHDLERLKAVEFSSFASTNAPVMMVAHIAVPALDPSALPATLSPTILSYLRNDLKYNGILMTDAMDMGAILLHHDYAAAALESFEAGMDMILLGANVSNADQIAAYNAILDAVRSGQISVERLNESVRRILTVKERYGLLQWSALLAATTTERIAESASGDVLRRVYEAAITVLRNEQANISLLSNATVGVVYSSQHLNLPVLCQVPPQMELLRVNYTPRSFEVSQAAALAKRTQFIIVFTEDAEFVPEQQVLVNSLPADKVIVVALHSPYDWRTFPQVGGVILTYEPTDDSIRAACDVLFGRQQPSGRLPVRIGDTYNAGWRALP